MKSLRAVHLALAFLALLLLLLARLAQLQILEHGYWEQEAKRSRTTERALPFSRGRLLDRNGVVMAEDVHTFDLHFRYREFRRGHAAGLLLESWLLLGGSPGGLPQSLERGEVLGELLLALTPADLRVLDERERGDMRFYLARLGGLDAKLDPMRLQVWEASSQTSFRAEFPQARGRFLELLANQRRDLARLEARLGLDRGELLARLETRRLDLELRIRQRAACTAAGKAFGLTASEVRRLLEPPQAEGAGSSAAVTAASLAQGEARAVDAARPTAAEGAWTRADFLLALAGRWRLRPELAGLEEIAGYLVRADWADPLQPLRELQALLQRIEEVAPDDARGLRRPLVKAVHQERSYVIARGVDFEIVDLIAREPGAWPGLEIVENPGRAYPGSIDPRLLGMVRMADAEAVADYVEARQEYQELTRLLIRSPEQERRRQELKVQLWQVLVRPNETRGRNGVEWALEDQLRGKRGYIEVLLSGESAEGHEELEFAPPENGFDARLSLDVALMQAAGAAIEAGYLDAARRARPRGDLKHRGAVLDGLQRPRVGMALLDLRTGATPVLASLPSFTVEEFRTEWAELSAADNADRPLRHRALGGGFTNYQTPYPGSTFKLVVAAEALATDPDWWTRELECQNVWGPVNASRRMSCEGWHGKISMQRAIEESCNVYFYKLGSLLGYEAIYRRALQLGFGAPTGIELGQGGGPGRDPNENLEKGANSLRRPGEARGSLDALHLAIGQANVVASPLQMARLFGWVATGRLWTPRLVLEAGGVPTTPRWTNPDFPAAQRELLKRALRGVVESPQGTAYDDLDGMQLGDFRVAGKTGTAQVSSSDRGGSTLVHAWFVGYFPHDDPRYAVAVLCENAGLHGGEVATLVLHRFLSSEAAARLLEQ